MKYQLFAFIWGFLSNACWASQEENNLRSEIFNGYNKNVRPVDTFSKQMDVTIGLAVQNIESFNQIEETIQLNIWLRKYWKNDILNWNTSETAITQLSLNSDDVWTPDIELLNAATQPDIYTLKGGMYLYSDGSMLWSMPAVYKFSCALQLENFPFDTQDCSLKFGSWTYDNTLLTVNPHGTASTQIDVLDSFSHSEWNLQSFYVSNYNETRDCCGDKLFDINEYHFLLSRYTHYYKLNMGMTISLVIVSFIIMLVKPDNLSRTGTAVFIPLTILALQLTIADKIPVVGYYTLMDQFFLTCFITSMIVSIESGIVYTMITSKSDMIFRLFDRVINYDTILKKLRDTKFARVHVHFEHEDFIKMKKLSLFPIVGDETSNATSDRKLIETDLDSLRRRNLNTGSEDEFDLAANILVNTLEDAAITKEREAQKTPDVETQADITKKRQRIVENINRDIINDNTIVGKNVVKTIDFDNKSLSLTYKEFLLFNEITRIFTLVDNVFRIVLPTIFFIIIGVIFSNETENISAN
jgi:hypothetical protein